MMRLGYLNILVFLLFFAASIAPVSAQQEFILKGAILEKGTKTRVAAAQIVNKRTGLFVLSNDFGLFQIKTVPGDSLLVIKMEYSDGIAVAQPGKDLIVYLDRGTTLKEVNIIGQTKRQELNDIKRDFRNKGSFYQGKPPFLSFLFKPLTAVYELLGRTPKNARRFGRYYETEMQQTLIDGFFNESIIQNNTDLKGDILEKYMIDYRPEYEKAKNWTEYDAIKYIRESYKKYTDTLKK
ncbi:hypothetical protein [Pedobacter foliorum]|uniref:hypothetical protein n=1 Tax=Pedobacter foliorum TaxID=2739058 RepID=UPI001565EDA2|nr:hypothetical protein [Pedobacter foliorum]NRF41719.1 hypothetical protein [Pedobacter foliorum]